MVVAKKILFPNNCPILERTGDGIVVGRCMYHCPQDVCPRHGDVHKALEVYRKLGKLTDEKLHTRVFPPASEVTESTKKIGVWQKVVNWFKSRFE